MIHLTHTSAVPWPAPPSAAVAPVAAIPGVSPVGREGHAGPRATREDRASSPFRHAQAQGDRPGAGAAPPPPEHVDVSASQAQAAERRQAEQAARERDRQAMEHLREVLTSVWQASAAVVDRALGRGSDDIPPGNPRSDTAPDLSQVAAALVARRTAMAGRPAGQAAPSPGAWRHGAPAAPPESPPAEVQAYDERGHGSVTPFEAGRLVSRRV